MNTVVETDADRIAKLSAYAGKHNRVVDLEQATDPVRLAILALRDRGGSPPYNLRLWLRTRSDVTGWVDPGYLSQDAVGLSRTRQAPPEFFYGLRDILAVMICGDNPA
jgi:hypothetical protein